MRPLFLHVLTGFSVLALGTGGEPIEVSMQKLNSIEWSPGDEIPVEVTQFDGERVEISGYMRNGTLEGESWFDLTNDSCGCGTGKLQHFVRVSLSEGTTTFTPGEMTLTGAFEVSEKEDEDGFVESLYRMKTKSLDQ
ncbi:MAG: hypothetical protein ACI8X5_000157 [Planctomycetota bacterium]|jgi:hypothetical protein